ncbi:MAG: DUF362 domain-containing protein [Pseudomonadota bacterium]
MPHRVALIKQTSYEQKSLEASIRRAVELTGFDLSSARGKCVLLKPNLLGAYPPSMGVTTHPHFVAAVGCIFKQAGAHVSVGDSPNGVHSIQKTWEVTGMREVCRIHGFAEAPFEASGSVERAGLRIAKALAQADMIINLPKFKTHGLTVLTLAVKNLFGCINGMQKSSIHRAHPDAYDFSEQVVRIADCVCPHFNIIDGIVAMEGDGPSGGNLIELGVIAAGQNMHFVDAICCKLIGLSPKHLDTLAAALQLKLLNDVEDILVVGDSMDELRPPCFKLPSTYTHGMRDWWISKLVMRIIWHNMSAQPVIDENLCKRCNLCVNACPVLAIDEGEQDFAPKINSEQCIQCFCCHEVCPHRAIQLRRSPLLKIWQWFADRRIRL